VRNSDIAKVFSDIADLLDIILRQIQAMHAAEGAKKSIY
jgi:hypothetical protein